MTWSPLRNSEGNFEVTRIGLAFKVIVCRYFRVIVPIIWSEVRSRKYRPLKDSQKEHTEEKKYLPVSALVTFRIGLISQQGTSGALYGEAIRRSWRSSSIYFCNRNFNVDTRVCR